MNDKDKEDFSNLWDEEIIQKLQSENAKLKDDNKKLRECVDWYIDLGLVEGYAKNLLKKLDKK